MNPGVSGTTNPAYTSRLAPRGRIHAAKYRADPARAAVDDLIKEAPAASHFGLALNFMNLFAVSFVICPLNNDVAIFFNVP
jgi:hypothetical protein